jgi:predicted P-loop ATPase
MSLTDDEYAHTPATAADFAQDFTQPSRPPRPSTAIDTDSIPASLKVQRRWGLWEPVWRFNKSGRGRWEKVPQKSTNKPEDWLTFDQAMNRRDGLEDVFGLGFLLTGIENTTAFDLDHVLDEKGKPKAWAADLIVKLASYTEVTVGGDGLRIFVQGAYKSDWINKDSVSLEVYSGHGGRFVTMTGDLWPGAANDIMPPPDGVLEAIEAEHRLSTHSEQIVVTEMPELLEGVVVPDNLNFEAWHFLETGFCNEDRSSALQWTARSLFEVGLDEQEVLSVLAENEFAMVVALDHRRQDEERARLYIWKHHVLKAKAKASPAATAEDFADLAATDPRKALIHAELDRLASMDEAVFLASAKDEAQKLAMTVGDLKKLVAKRRKSHVASTRPVGLPNFDRADDGQIKASAKNTTLAVSHPSVSQIVLGYDTFRDEIMFHPVSDESAQWQTFLDQQYNWLRVRMDEIGFAYTPSIEMVRAAVDDVARQNSFDSAQLWLESLPEWDGVPRVTKFHHRYLGSEDGEWSDAVSEYLWTALVARVMDPGCQADMVPVWISDEGKRKSTIVAEIAPSRDFVTMMSFHEKETDLARKMRGRLVAEIAELAGMARKEVEAAKAWITKRFEDWTPKFKEFNTQFPRRFIPIGTTNRSDFLVSETGNRRFLPIETPHGNHTAVAADRDQLWAEALEMWKDGGLRWEDAHTLGKALVGNHMAHEPWTDDIHEWLYRKDFCTRNYPADQEFIPTTKIMQDALRIEPGRKNSADSRRVATAMRALGYETDHRGPRQNRQRGWKAVRYRRYWWTEFDSAELFWPDDAIGPPPPPPGWNA